MISTCNKCNNNRVIKVSENKSSFIITNLSRKYINTIQVDGCFISSGNKCDYLFEILEGICDNDVSKVLYVELKGTDIEHAIKQLKATINHCNSIHANSIKECYIIAVRVPKAGPKTQVLKKKFKTTTNIPLYIDTVSKNINI